MESNLEHSVSSSVLGFDGYESSRSHKEHGLKQEVYLEHTKAEATGSLLVTALKTSVSCISQMWVWVR